MVDTLTIGIIQREIIPHDPPGNLQGVMEMMNKCLSQNVELFILTELFTTGQLDADDPSTLENAEDISGPTFKSLAEYAYNNSVWLLAGSIPVKRKDGISNTSLLFNPQGETVLEYSKTHMFSPMGENRVFIPGDKLAAADINGIGVGVVICYDLRFPRLIRHLVHSGVELLIVPALWPETRINHWDTLLRARAMENQVWVAGANGLGKQNDTFFPGHSMIVSPAGDAVNTPEMRESAIVRTINIARLRELRAEICYLDDENDISGVEWNKG